VLANRRMSGGALAGLSRFAKHSSLDLAYRARIDPDSRKMAANVHAGNTIADSLRASPPEIKQSLAFGSRLNNDDLLFPRVPISVRVPRIARPTGCSGAEDTTDSLLQTFNKSGVTQRTAGAAVIAQIAQLFLYPLISFGCGNIQ
jgi:hypothetical protein